MSLQNIKIGFALTGSFCCFDEVFKVIEKLTDSGADLWPILSYHAGSINTRFGTAEYWRDRLVSITGHVPIDSIDRAEPIGPQKLLDLVIVAPCTGNSLAKISNGITDTPALMAAKSHLRNQRPLLIAPATNDGLGNNGKNIGALLAMKNIYLVPFGQDGPDTKINSLQSRFSLIPQAAELALKGKQMHPILLGAKECLTP